MNHHRLFEIYASFSIYVYATDATVRLMLSFCSVNRVVVKFAYILIKIDEVVLVPISDQQSTYYFIE